MKSFDEHRKRVAKFPEDVRKAHKHSTKLRMEIEASKICGCFCCCSIFGPDEIVDWTDENEEDVGQTAICPYCLIDSVIGSVSGFPINEDFLNKMKKYWF